MNALGATKIWDSLSQDYAERVFATITFPGIRRRILQSVKRGRLLDLGCGPLPHLLDSLSEVPDSRTFACDFSLSMIATARNQVRSQRICFVLGDARSLPISAASFDTVIAINSIIPEERSDADLMFKEVLRILRPQGRLIALLPAFETSPIAQQHWGIDVQIDMASHREYDTSGWQCFYTAGDIEQLMKRHSFSRFHLEQLYFSSREEIRAIQRIYGEHIPEKVLLEYPLFEHLLVADL